MAWLDIVLAPLRLFLSVFLFIISPITALGGFFLDLVVQVFNIPLWVVRKLEVIYIYLGIAFLVGITLGLVFYLVSTCIFSIFSLDAAPSPSERHANRRKGRVSTTSSATATEIDAYSIPGTPVFSIPAPSGKDKGRMGLGSTGRSGMGMGPLDISPLSPTSIAPGFNLGSDGSGRKRIFPILEEEDEHDEELKRKRGNGKGKKRI